MIGMMSIIELLRVFRFFFTFFFVLLLGSGLLVVLEESVRKLGAFLVSDKAVWESSLKR